MLTLACTVQLAYVMACVYVCAHRWLEDQQEEFYQQGDDERRQDLPVSALCDRHTPGGVYKSQVGFGEFVSLPLFRSLAARFPGCAPFVAAAESLHAYWSEQSNNA